MYMCVGLTIRKRRMRSKRDWLAQQGRKKERKRKNEDEDFLVEFSLLLFLSLSLDPLFIPHRNHADTQLVGFTMTHKGEIFIIIKNILVNDHLSSKRK